MAGVIPEKAGITRLGREPFRTNRGFRWAPPNRNRGLALYLTVQIFPYLKEREPD